MKTPFALFVGFFIWSTAQAQIYFPPKIGNTWQTVSPASLGWCVNQLDSLEIFLDTNHTKGFLILKDGQIAYEKYFGNFTADSNWYWASASKSLFGFLMGIAVSNGQLNIADTASQYLGLGWTSCTATEEQKITVQHMLSMNSGINDNVPNVDCTLPSCLTCLQPPNQRWAYHNAVYTLSHKVLENATNKTINQYTITNLQLKIGMGGTWIKNGYNEFFVSKLRDMARFGILVQNDGIWQNDTLLQDSAYFYDMVHTSQTINKSYGYLWWLNGQNSFMLPQTQIIFQGPLFPYAPADLWCALGRDDQKLYISQNLGLVICRLGNDSGGAVFGPSGFDNLLWQELNKLFCNAQGVIEHEIPKFFFSNAPNYQTLKSDISGKAQLFNLAGQQVAKMYLQAGEEVLVYLPKGMYTLFFTTNRGVFTEKLFVF